MGMIMNKIKSILSVLITLSILTTCFFNTYAKGSDKLVIELKVGSNKGIINGIESKVETPFISDKTIMIPLSWVTMAIGAEVNQKANKKIEIIYGELNAELTIGSKSYTANSITYMNTVAPIVKNGRTMVPLEFISKNFPVSVTSDIKKGNIKIVLEDDGALNDLSFLTGGIISSKIGNSYYGWSINIPTGSRIISNSFKSDKIGITNESRGLYIEISVVSKNDKKLKDLYDDFLYSNSLRDSKLDLKATIPYFQYIRLSEYDEALRVKVFEKGDYFYYLTINSYNDTVTPEQLLTDKYYDNIINSFSLDYKGNVKGVEDVSKIKNGEVNFYNYINLNQNTKYLPWSLNIPVKWNEVLQDYDPLSTNLGLDNQRYMCITTNILSEEEELEEYVDSIKKYYDKYFNPKAYSFISSDFVKIADGDAYNLKFKLKPGKNVYIVDEYYFIKNGFVYEISINLPENEYEKLQPEFLNAINNMTYYTVDEGKYKKDLEKYENKNTVVRVSQQDEVFEFINKSYNWSAKIPGYFTKSSYYDSTITFDNPNTRASVMIACLENSSYTKTLTDEDKFVSIKTLKTYYKVTPTETTSNEKGSQVRTYTFKVESQEDDFYASVICKCFETDKYSYCYLSILPELTATEEATKELEDIWESFKITQ